MYAFLVLVASCIVQVLGSGELIILNHPKDIILKGSERLEESFLPDVYAVALGYTITKDISWSGMKIKSPFYLSKAIVTIAVDGVNTLNIPNGHVFPLSTNLGEKKVFEDLESFLDKQQFGRDPNQKIHRVRFELLDGLDAVHPHAGDVDEEDEEESIDNILKGNLEKRIVEEITNMNILAKNANSVISSNSNAKDVFWMKVSGLHDIVHMYGENSTETIQAKHRLTSGIQNICDAFYNVYEGKAFCNVIVSDAMHTRHIRAVDDKADKADEQDWNLAKNYDPSYPAIFNIILWFGVSMFFSLLAICIFISSMDPGRDSIIYRMTSTRMKKDN